MRKHFWPALVAFCMALTLMPTWAFAVEPEELESPEEVIELPKEQPEQEETTAPSEGPEQQEETSELPEEQEDQDEYTLDLSEEMETGDERLLRSFYGDDGIQPLGEIGTTPSYNNLNYYQRELYTYLRAWIKGINTQERNTSAIWTHTYRSSSEAVAVWQNAIANGNLSKIVYCVEADLPGDFYWFGNRTSSTRNGATITIQFRVAAEYRVSGNEHVISGAQISRAHSALTNARAIISKASGLSTAYEKLDYYRSEICRLVSYNRYAASGALDPEIEDPWQLVWVFDGDPSTNVVCEGYSKAFQYLCDNTSWGSERVECFIVTGYAGGPHMWNVVRINGRNYLTDITNCDSGTIGYPKKLFLAGATGNPNLGYLTAVGIVYTYDNDYANSSILTLSDTDYIPNPVTALRGVVSITGTPNPGNILQANVSNLLTATGQRPSGLTYVWRADGVICGRESQYTVQARDAGKAITVTVSAENCTNSITSAPVTVPDGLLHGTVTASITYAISGETVTLRAIPDAGYRLSSIQVTGGNGQQVPLSGSGSIYTFSMPSFDVFVHAQFTKV